MADTGADGARAEFDTRDARIIGARSCMDAGADGTHAKRKQFGVFLCLPMVLVLLLIWNGDFGMSPIYEHHRARRRLP